MASGQQHSNTKLPSNQKQSGIAIVESRDEFFSGPIPPPQTMAGYETALPGSADRILKMAEEQSAHRQEMEKETD